MPYSTYGGMVQLAGRERTMEGERASVSSAAVVVVAEAEGYRAHDALGARSRDTRERRVITGAQDTRADGRSASLSVGHGPRICHPLPAWDSRTSEPLIHLCYRMRVTASAS